MLLETIAELIGYLLTKKQSKKTST